MSNAKCNWYQDFSIFARSVGGRGACLEKVLRRQSAGHDRCVAWKTERRPRGASRAALAPTFVSGQLFLWDSRANALVHASISRRTNKAAARACHRRYWPETNVGASAARDCAARAALDLTGAEDAPATLARNHRISHRDHIRADRCLPQGMAAPVRASAARAAQS